MKRISLLLLFITLIESPGFAQKDNKLDSLINYVKTAEQDTNKANALISICRSMSGVGEYMEAKKYADEALKLSQKLNYKKGQAKAYNQIGNVHSYMSDYPEALENFQKALSLNEQLGNKSGVGTSLGNIGIVYQRLSDNKNAMVYFQKAYNLFEELGQKTGMANNLGNMGAVCFEGLRDYPKALEYFFKSLELFEKLGRKDGMVRSLENAGTTYFILGDYPKALDYLQQSLKLSEEIGDKNIMGDASNNLASVYIKLKDFNQASKHQERGLSIALEIGDKVLIRNAYGNYTMIDSAKNDFKAAFLHHKLFMQYNDSIFNSDNKKKITELAMQYEFDKKSVADSIKAGEEKKVISAQLQQEQTKSYALYGGLALLMVFGGFMFNRFKITQKQNKIIEKQKGVVEEKNREILDSIAYALRIQTAILPPQRLVKQHLVNFFILYKPKDIVAGDFYWMETVNDLVLFAACDCTGHGVPGAMVSVVCHNALNRAVREFGLTQPAAILDKTAALVTENFSKSEENIKDGMDISLCAYNTKTKKLEWAGANSPIWLLQNGELVETKADKQAIGDGENSKPFTNHQFTLQTGESIYIFTDGYADQFGGESQKKLTRKRFKDLLVSVQGKSLPEQGLALDQFIANYRKE
ncbi:MAG TPA: tetratricopeptide repeat protein, partial [Bacteroidia bacterium]